MKLLIHNKNRLRVEAADAAAGAATPIPRGDINL
jgi:hypothetical protein